MSEIEQQVYLELVQELLKCPQDQELLLLRSKPELVNKNLVNTLIGVAQMFERQGSQESESTVKWLLDFAKYLAEQLGLELRFEEEEPRTVPVADEQLQFLWEVLRLVAESDSDPQLVYALLSKNLALLNEQMIEVLTSWVRSKLAESESVAKELLARIVDEFGKLMEEFPLGNKAINMDLTIACQEIFIEVFTFEKHPEDWARTQYNLAHDYIKRIGGDRADNLEKSISCYTLALDVRTKKDLPIDWARTQSNLAIAYSTRMKGDKADNLEKSITCATAALEVITKEELPIDWGRIYYNLADVYDKRTSGDKADNLEKSITCYMLALKVITKENLPTQWQNIQSSLGNIYINRIEGNRTDNLEKSIHHYNLALEIQTKEDFPFNWAMTQSNLAIAYRDRIKGDKDDNLEKLIACCMLALEIQTKKELPMDWAKNQWSLADAYSERNRGNRIDNLEKSIDCYESSLYIYNKNDFPHQWATLQNDLAIVYMDRIKGDKSENLEKSIVCSTLALQVRTKGDFPYDWAATQNNLAAAYILRIKGDKSENLENSILCLSAALEVYINGDSLIDCIKNQQNLAAAYILRIKGDKSENLENSITYSIAALETINKDALPIEWMKNQNTLASAYSSRIKGDEADNLEKSIAIYTLVLNVISQEDLPIDWAMTQYNLASVYSSRIKGDKASNLEKSIAGYTLALEIYEKEGMPIECLRTAKNLGNLHFHQENWQQAIDAYLLAITAVEQSHSWGSSDQSKKEIIEGAIVVYFNLVQSCINTQQFDKALEYAERSKARNLVQLLANRDLYPKGDIPAEIRSQLKTLRQQVLAQESLLNQRQNTERTSMDASSRSIASPQAITTNLDRQRLLNLKQDLEYLTTTHIQPIDPSFQLTQQVQPISFADIQGVVPNSQTVLLTWYLSNDRIHTFLVTSEGSQPHTFSSTKEQYSALINALDNYLDLYLQNKSLWREELSNLLQQLSQSLNLPQIITKLQEIAPTCDRIVLIPHRSLHLIPLHALPLTETGECLLDLFPQGVSYAPSIQLLNLAQQWNRPPLQRLLAIQNPTNDLKYTDVEVPVIRARFYPHVETLKGERANKTALNSVDLNQVNCVHFSCHGSFNFENPLASALILGGSTLSEPLTQLEEKSTRYLSTRNGKTIDLEQCLTLGEIFQLDLNQCRLVTLSACETGLTDFRSIGDEYIGLPSGFLYAGSANVVSSLWAVDDLSTTFLMIKFYQNLAQTDSIAIALNQAQQWLRQVTKVELFNWIDLLSLSPTQQVLVESWTDKQCLVADSTRLFQSPYHWAAFCAIG